MDFIVFARYCRLFAGAALALSLVACGLLGGRSGLRQTYDFGVAPAEAHDVHAHWLIGIADVEVPSALDSSAISYRLAYSSPIQPRSYAESQWAMPPGELLAHRIKQRFARNYIVVSGAQTRRDYTLQLQLEEFSQVFDSPTTSHAQVRMRATLIKNDGSVLAQTVLNQERPAATPDAAGGATALVEASDAVADALLAWVGDNLK